MKRIIPFLCILFMGFVGCSRPIIHEKQDIVAVWKHDVGIYSVTIQTNGEYVDKGFVYQHCDAVLVPGLPKETKIYYEATFNTILGDLQYTDIKIHIHSLDEINCAGWNHGKGGKGMIEKVEIERNE